MTDQDRQPEAVIPPPTPPPAPPPAPPAAPAAPPATPQPAVQAALQPPPAPSAPTGAWSGPSESVGPVTQAPGQAGSGWDAVAPAPAGRSRRGWLIGCGLLLLLLVVGMGACGALLVNTFGSAGAVLVASNGQIDGFNAQSINGRNQLTFQAAQGVDGEDGIRLACEVVRPALAGSDLEGTPWVIVNRAGDVIGSSETACP